MSVYIAESANRKGRIAVVRFSHEGDYLIAVGIYPVAIEDGSVDIATIHNTIRHGE